MTELQPLQRIKNIQPDREAVFTLGPAAPVEICQLEGEFSHVLHLFRDEQPCRLLEIGTAAGGTLYHWLTEGSGFLELAVTVDWPESGYELDADACAGWADATELVMIQGDCHDSAIQEQIAAYAPFDWLFIDGAHTYLESLRDWNDYRKMVSPGGLVFLHDIALRRTYEDGRESGVHRLWREIQADGFWTREFRERPNLNQYGIGCIRV